MSKTQLAFVGMLCLGLLAGCAGVSGRHADYSQPAEGKFFCRSGGTPTCFERLGKPVTCTCATRADLVRLLDGR